MKKNNRRWRHLGVAIFLAMLASIVLSMPVSAADAASNGIDAISETGIVSESESESRPLNSTSVGGSYVPDRKTAPAVSYGLRVMAAKTEMVFSGLCGNEITFTADDIRRAMNLSSLDYITVVELPEVGEGTLFVGSVGAGKGQVISAGSMGLLSFAAADDQKPSEATMKIAVNGSDYAVTCRLCMLDRLNYTPTVTLAPTITLNMETYRNIPVSGTVSAYDPEGDEMTYEITRYAEHGRVVLTDTHTGAYTYTPDSTYVGRDSFSYVVRDQYGNYSTSATVSIQISVPPASVTYSDIEGNDHAAAVIQISALGFMNGTQIGSECYFKPEASISRLEFLVTAMQAAGITAADVADLAAPSVADCDDIPVSMQSFVTYALNRGYLSTKTLSGKQYFRPNDSISRAEAAVILSNIIGYATEDTVTAFTDADTMPVWSTTAFTSLRALGIVSAPDGNANAGTIMSRAMTAEWLVKALQLMNQ